MISSAIGEMFSSTQESSCECVNKDISMSIYEKLSSHNHVKNLLVNLHNKLSTMDSRIEVSFESIKTKIR